MHRIVTDTQGTQVGIEVFILRILCILLKSKLQCSDNLGGDASVVFQQGDVSLQALTPGQFANMF